MIVAFLIVCSVGRGGYTAIVNAGVTMAPPLLGTTSSKITDNIFRLGINYRFH